MSLETYEEEEEKDREMGGTMPPVTKRALSACFPASMDMMMQCKLYIRSASTCTRYTRKFKEVAAVRTGAVRASARCAAHDTEGARLAR